MIGIFFYSHLPMGRVERTITQVCALFKEIKKKKAKHNISSAICTTFNKHISFVLFFLCFFSFFIHYAKNNYNYHYKKKTFHLNGIRTNTTLTEIKV